MMKRSTVGVAAATFVIGMAASAHAGPWQDAQSADARGDYATELSILQPMADQGDATAQYNLGNMYENGHGVERSNHAALVWYRKAADQGDLNSSVNIGVHYATGQGVPQDYEQAVLWFRKAAIAGNATAQLNLGKMYEKGQGVAQDYMHAIKWYQRAAYQGNAIAQLFLGEMYTIGEGVAQDKVQAHKWCNLAAIQGNPDALSCRDNAAIRMTDEQITEAQRLAHVFVPFLSTAIVIDQ